VVATAGRDQSGRHTVLPAPKTAVFAPLPPRTPLPPVDCAEQACLALTFDDGPSPAVTPQVLTVLEKHHVHATFFMIGTHVPGNENLLRRMYQDGHELGNHSWSHPDFTTLPVAQIEMQIAKAQSAITAAGVPAPTLFRPPYGAVNAVVKAHVPLTFAMWNVDPEDWHQKNPKDIVSRIEANARPGRVIDLHDIHQPTADALDQLLTDLAPHYEFVTFSQLFNLAPGQPGVFYGR
jgi:peptidoglycan-N-acetylglucosamine deacetylase